MKHYITRFSFPVRHSCQDALRAAMRDDAVHAVVLCGAGGKFLGGADIKEFNSADNVFLRGQFRILIRTGLVCANFRHSPISRYADSRK